MYFKRKWSTIYTKVLCPKNGGNNMETKDFFETDDLDMGVDRRKTLIEELKELQKCEDKNQVQRTLNDIRRRWRQIPSWESVYEESLQQEYEALMDEFYQKRNELYKSSKEAKQALIDETKELLSKDVLPTYDKVNELMEQWKQTGSAGKETDDTLWEEFNALRQSYFERRRQNWQDIKEKYHSAKAIKESLIEKAKEWQASEDWQKASEFYRDLMEQWKQAGYAGKDHDDRLWEAFNEARQVFYARRQEHYDALHKVQQEHFQEKKGLIEKAKGIAASQEYTRENTEAMKQLNVDWKAVGSCGRKHEDALWEEFSSILDEYFAQLKQLNEQRHEQWRQRMNEVRTHKQETIQNQKRIITRLQNDLGNVLGEQAQLDLEDEIAQKEAFIEQLEAEIADIESKLEK